jgi:TetR/AcrR family transcriptional regulator, mexJK operon transcriptional repressor
MSAIVTATPADPAGRAIRRTRRGDAKSEQIRATATELFLRRGYDGVSVDEIVRIVGGSKTNVYNHFGGKEGLFAAIVNGLCEDALASFVTIDVANLSVEKGLRALAVTLLGILLEEKLLAVQRLVIAESMRFPALGRAWIRSGPERSRRIIARFIEQQQRAGRLRQCDPHQSATLFHDMICFDLVHRAIVGDQPTDDDVRQRIESAIEVLLHGIARIEAPAAGARQRVAV